MPEYLSPGVDIQEVVSRIRGIRRAATTIPGFVGIAEKGPIGVATLITSANQFMRVFGTYVDGHYLKHAVEHFFKYVKGRCYVVRTCHYTGEPPIVPSAVVATVSLVDGATEPVPTLQVDALSLGAWGNSLTITITVGYNDEVNEFNLIVKLNGVIVETFNNISMVDANSNFAEKVINTSSNYIVVTDLDSDSNGSTPPEDIPAVIADEPLVDGEDGLAELEDADYVGSSAIGNGLYALASRDDISAIAVPGVTTQTVHEGMVTFAELDDKYLMAILDAAQGETPTEVETYVRDTAGFNTKEGMILYPWPVMMDPVSAIKALFPPSGHFCGLIAKTDLERGVHKAPAGTHDGRLMDVLDLEIRLDKATLDVLYPARINCLIFKSGIGEVVWGNRTLSYDTSWEQFSVRRTYHNVAKSILNGTQWVVFEPNNQDTRARVHDAVYALLLDFWRDGAFYDGGSGDPDDAFFVTCDETNNPADVVEAGRLYCDIGIVFTRAAEFVIFRIGQWDGGRIIEEVTS